MFDLTVTLYHSHMFVLPNVLTQPTNTEEETNTDENNRSLQLTTKCEKVSTLRHDKIQDY